MSGEENAMVLKPNVVDVTVLTSDQPTLMKTFGVNGGKATPQQPGKINRGSYECVNTTLQGIGGWYTQMNRNKCICLGSTEHYSGQILRKDDLSESDPETTISRSKKHIKFYDKNTLMLLDTDHADLSHDEIDQALETVIVGFENLEKLITASSSAGLLYPDGSPASVGTSRHVLLVVPDGTDIPRAMKMIHRRLVINGFGHGEITAAGTIKIKSLVDVSVANAHGIIYEAAPQLNDGLTQNRPNPEYIPGEILYTLAYLPDLTPDEQKLYDAKEAEIRAGLQEKADAIKAAHQAKLSVELVERSGVTQERATEIISSRGGGEAADPDDIVYFNRKKWIRVGDITSDHHGMECLDFENPSYDNWRPVAKIYVNPDGSIVMNSMAHGGDRTFTLRKPDNLRPEIAFAEPAVVPEGVSSTPLPPVTTEDTMVQMINRFVYMRDGNKVIDMLLPPQHAVMKKEEFITAFKPLGKVDVVGGGSPPFAVNAFFSDHRRRGVVGERYHPGKDMLYDADGVAWFNPFHKPIWVQTSDKHLIAPIIEHLLYMFPGDDQYWRFLCWLAWTAIRPEIRLKHTPLLISKHHGTGRGFLTELLSVLLGVWNTSAVTMEILSGQGSAGGYHNYLHQTLFCSIAEVKVDAKNAYAVDDAIRDKLTAETLTLNLKYGANGMYPIFTNFLMASNHRDALVLTAEDRRIDVYEHFNDKRSEQEYTTLYNLLTDEVAMAQFYWFLHDWCVTNEGTYNPHAPAPLSSAKQRMIGGGENDVTRAFNLCLKSVPSDVLTQGMIKELWLIEYMKITGCEQLVALTEQRTCHKQIEMLTRKELTLCNNGGKVKISQEIGSHKLFAIRNDAHWANASTDALRAEFAKFNKRFQKVPVIPVLPYLGA